MWKPLTVLAFLASAGAVVSQQVTSGVGGTLRALDKTSGNTLDIEMAVGQARALGTLKIVMNDCRYPAGNPSGNAYAALEISETGKTGALFSGWMIASSPALSALEHPRYDVWVIRCSTS